MTGFIGERSNRQVALVTDDFRLYHDLAPFFEAHGVQLLGLRPGEAVPDSVAVLLGGPPTDARSVAVRPAREATWIATMAKLDERGQRMAVIGVDPGQTFGLALLVDDAVYWWCTAHSVHDAVRYLLAWRDGLAPGSWQARIGDGAPRQAFALLQALRAAWPGLDVRLVPEHGSTPVSPRTDSRHTDAAIAIALRGA